jgi:tetratricopeptide (TPR) repeat protein
MNRLLAGVLLSFAAGTVAAGQTASTAAPDQKTVPAQVADWHFDKPEVLRLIALNESVARDGESAHADCKRMAMIYSNLGILYADVGMSLKAEDAFRQAIALLRDGPQDQLADVTEQMAALHLAMNKVPEAEKEEIGAFKIRQAVGDPVGIALAESTLAGLYDEERKFAKAADYAGKAYDVLANRQDVSALDRIGVRHTLGFALTGMRDCDRGIEVLKEGLDLAKTTPGIEPTSVGYGEYVLGYGYWHCGDRDHASLWMERGTTDMRAEFGWGHAIYVNAMKQYARFLRESGRQDAAVSAEAVVNQAESVVDAGALTGRTEGFRAVGAR